MEWCLNIAKQRHQEEAAGGMGTVGLNSEAPWRSCTEGLMRERETGLKPATLCLEGRCSID